MARTTTKAAKTKRAAKKPEKTKLHIAGLDLKSRGETNLTYYFVGKKVLSGRTS